MRRKGHLRLVQLLRGFVRDLKKDFKTRWFPTRQEWVVMLFGIFGPYIAMLIAGQDRLANPVVVSLAALIFLWFLKPGLRQFVWFWVILAIFACLHAALIFCIHWPDASPRGAVLMGAAVCDAYAMLAVVDFAAQFTKNGHHSSRGAHDSRSLNSAAGPR